MPVINRALARAACVAAAAMSLGPIAGAPASAAAPPPPSPKPTLTAAAPAPAAPLMPSLDALISDWNTWSDVVHGADPAIFEAVPLDRSMFAAVPGSRPIVVAHLPDEGFAAPIAVAARLDAGTGEVTALLAMLDPYSPSKETVVSAVAVVASPSQAFVDRYLDRFNATLDLPLGTITQVHDEVTATVEAVPGSTLMAVAVMAPTDDATAAATAVELRTAAQG